MKLKMTILALVAITAATAAQAAQAMWTGRQEMVQTVTGKFATKCEYDYYGQKFWRLFQSGYGCPSSVEVE